MRYTTRHNHDRVLGPTVEVYDTLYRRAASVFNGPYADQRAEHRSREMNAQDEETERARSEEAD